MERVDSYGFDFGVLTRATNIAADYTQSTIDLPTAREQMDNIATTGKSWSKKATIIATAAAGAAALLVYGGDWIVSIAGVIAYLTLVFMMQKLGSLRWPSFFIQIAAGILASTAAAAMRILDPNVDPTSVVISIIIIIMMAGMTSTGAVQDTITGHYMHGLGKIYEGLVNTAGLVVGVRLGAALFNALGVPLPVSNEVSLASIPLWLMVIAAALVAVGNGIILQSPARVVFSAATLAMIVYPVYAALSTGQGADAWARGVAAFAAGIGTAILPRMVKAPSSSMAISSFLVLLPGTLTYQGIWGSSLAGDQALYYLSSAFIAALSLATGLMVGQYVGVVTLNTLNVVRNRIFTPMFFSRASNHPLTRRGGKTSNARDTEGTSDTDTQE